MRIRLTKWTLYKMIIVWLILMLCQGGFYTILGVAILLVFHHTLTVYETLDQLGSDD